MKNSLNGRFLETAVDILLGGTLVLLQGGSQQLKLEYYKINLNLIDILYIAAPVVTILMPPPYLFPFSVPCTVVHTCTGEEIIHRIFRPFLILFLPVSSTHLEMERTGPLWKTSPPSSLQWTPALLSTRRPPYPSSRAQSEFLPGFLFVWFI